MLLGNQSSICLWVKAFFKLVEWPVLKTSLPGVAGLIFMLCLTSFTLVLTLGGGPKAATLEVVIYQALRFDYDPGLALSLALAQLGLCVGLMMIVQKFARPILPSASLGLAQAGMKNGNHNRIKKHSFFKTDAFLVEFERGE